MLETNGGFRSKRLEVFEGTLGKRRWFERIEQRSDSGLSQIRAGVERTPNVQHREETQVEIRFLPESHEPGLHLGFVVILLTRKVGGTPVIRTLSQWRRLRLALEGIASRN